LYSCLRSYRDIIALEKNKCTLENVIEASTRIFEEEDISHLESSLVFQVSTLLYAPEDGEIIDPDAKVMCLSLNDNKQMEVKAALGEWGEYQTTTMDTLPEHLLAALEKAQQSHNNVYQERVAGLYFATPAGKEFLVCAEAIEDITAFERDVLEIFCYNTGLALKKTLAPSGGSAGAIDTAHNDEKHAYIDTIGKVVDSHYKVAGSHSSKMSAITKLVAQRVGMEDEAIDNLCDAVGILGLSSLSALPIKPSSDQPQIQQSIEKAIDLFDAETAPAMAVAVSLISQMNENFDGSGLPNHSEKSEISLEARVFRAVNDFYSAGLEQSETAWPISEMIKVLDDAKDQIYAPDVVEEIKTLMADIEAILNQS
jgi:HD-GYP domain-containing protein (c-di-GMP phosphodiesterase class II)